MRGRLSLVALALVAVPACMRPGEWNVGYPFPADPLSPGNGADGALELVSGDSLYSACRSLVTGTNDTLALASVNGIAPGDRLLVHQVQDVFATSGDPLAVSSGEAGTWEIAGVTAVSGTTVTLHASLAHGYRTDGAGRTAQACRVSQHTDITLSGTATLSAAPWNGSSGGVIALFATGRVLLEGTASILSVAGTGFRGGITTATPSTSCSVVLEDTNAQDGGPKGEGLDGRAYALHGRGNLANGGGGGNAGESGGGGGGSGGAGGVGADQHPACGAVQNGGRPGSGIALPILEQFTFGGGGGSGTVDDGLETVGGNGGGLLVIIAGEITGAGRFDASATDGSPFGASNGGGGGGAGGTIFLRAPAFTFSGAISADGGVGATVDPDHGPGGGGGGGRVRVSPAAQSAATITVNGGVSGTDGNDPRGALGGEPGLVELDD